MEKELLLDTVKKLMAPKKGILAADESMETAGKRLSLAGLENTAENRRTMRDLFFSAEGMERYVSGVILFDETIRQNSRDGTPFTKLLTDKGVVVGIKVDSGRERLESSPEEDVTQGLESLVGRLVEYFGMGARFTKWRAALRIGNDLPTDRAVEENAENMAQYASIAQKENLVPIVEPEVLMGGDHTMGRAGEVTEEVLGAVFGELERSLVWLPGAILKTSMVLPGSESHEKKTPKEIAVSTVRTLKKSVPKELGGVVFLSGGQTPQEAAENLNAIAREEPLPWEISFSYSRALEYPALDAWAGKDENIPSAQEAFVRQLTIDTLADQGTLLS